jgi:hypothetical protein
MLFGKHCLAIHLSPDNPEFKHIQDHWGILVKYKYNILDIKNHYHYRDVVLGILSKLSTPTAASESETTADILPPDDYRESAE